MPRKLFIAVLAAGAVAGGVLGGIGTATADEPPPGQSIPGPSNPWTEGFFSNGHWHAPLLSNPNSAQAQQLGTLLNPNPTPGWQPGQPVDPGGALEK